jgi:hypothetical protein
VIKLNKKAIGLIVMVGVFGSTLTGCGMFEPFKTPVFEEVEASQTAFLIPLMGDGSDQVKLDSEDAVKERLITQKRIEIPQTFVKTGNGGVFIIEGKWMPTAKIIKVERKPVTREWTEASATGTSSKNQGIKAESKESIGFTARMNCTASIAEKDAAKYLYFYNSTTLEEIMDSQIRAKVQDIFVAECSKRSMDEILSQKADIIKAVVDGVTSTFAGNGITISQLGLTDDFTYDNPDTQKAIDAKFQAEKAQEAQTIQNETNKSKALADAEVIKSQAATIKDSIELKKAEAMQTEARNK